MPAKIIDGKKAAEKILNEVREQIKALGKHPVLAVVQVGDNPASTTYVRIKQKKCEEAGIKSIKLHFEEDVSEERLVKEITALNSDKGVDGILVQLPLPPRLDENSVISAVSPDKDVDGITPFNLGRLLRGEESFVPCTPQGIIRLLKEESVGIEGARAVVIGRSVIVGKPISILLLQENATVTMCHSKTRNLKEETLSADILVVAAGKPGLVTREMVKPGAAVIDVGINRVDGRLTGDVDFEGVREVAGLITPVPGGVGPMTVACLLENTLLAAKKRLERQRKS